MTTEQQKRTIAESDIATIAPLTERIGAPLPTMPMTAQLPQRRSGVPPTMGMTAVMDARPSAAPPRSSAATVLTPTFVPPEPATYQAYSVGHLPPLRPPARRVAPLAPRIALAVLAVVIAGIVVAAAAAAC